MVKKGKVVGVDGTGHLVLEVDDWRDWIGRGIHGRELVCTQDVAQWIGDTLQWDEEELSDKWEKLTGAAWEEK